jgi:hypothetical protein
LFFGFSEPDFCSHFNLGFLRVGDAVTNENIIPTQVIACVFGQDYEITPISHEMMTLIYDPPSSDLLFYRGFAPGIDRNRVINILRIIFVITGRLHKIATRSDL